MKQRLKRAFVLNFLIFCCVLVNFLFSKLDEIFHQNAGKVSLVESNPNFHFDSFGSTESTRSRVLSDSRHDGVRHNFVVNCTALEVESMLFALKLLF